MSVHLLTYWDDCSGAHCGLWIDGELFYCTNVWVEKGDGNVLARRAAEEFLELNFDARSIETQDRETVWGRHGQLSRYNDVECTPFVRKPPSIAEATKRLDAAKRMREEIRIREERKKHGLGGLFGAE